MTSWLRCLACLRGPSSADPSIRLHLLSCQHIVCEPCASKAQRPNAGPESIFCPVCRACPVRCLPLNNKLPKAVSSVFQDVAKSTEVLKTAVHFQYKQREAVFQKWISDNRRQVLESRIRDRAIKNQELKQRLNSILQALEREKSVFRHLQREIREQEGLVRQKIQQHEGLERQKIQQHQWGQGNHLGSIFDLTRRQLGGDAGRVVSPPASNSSRSSSTRRRLNLLSPSSEDAGRAVSHHASKTSRSSSTGRRLNLLTSPPQILSPPLRDTEMIKMAMMENEKKRQRSREGLFQGSLIENAVYRPPKSTCVDLGPANKYNKQLLDLGPRNKPWQRRSFN